MTTAAGTAFFRLDDEPHSPSAMRMAPEEDWGPVVGCDQRRSGQAGVEILTVRRETRSGCRWNKSRAAAELGLGRVGPRARPDRCGIPQPGRAAADFDDTEED